MSGFKHDDIVILLKASKTIIQMLQDWEYVVPEAKVRETLDDFITKFSQDGAKLYTISAIKEIKDQLDDQDKSIIVFFPFEDKISCEHYTEYTKKMTEGQIFHCIIVLKGTITKSAMDSVEESWSVINVEIFKQDELQFNIMEHLYVPKHSVLSKTEKKSLLCKYRLRDHQLPKILVSDPVAKYYGVKKGHIVKIIRSSETAGKYVTYRIAI